MSLCVHVCDAGSGFKDTVLFIWKGWRQTNSLGEGIEESNVSWQKWQCFLEYMGVSCVMKCDVIRDEICIGTLNIELFT